MSKFPFEWAESPQNWLIKNAEIYLISGIYGFIKVSHPILPILKFLKCPILILYIKSKLQTNFEIWSKNAEKLETSKKMIGSTEAPVSTPGFT